MHIVVSVVAVPYTTHLYGMLYVYYIHIYFSFTILMCAYVIQYTGLSMLCVPITSYWSFYRQNKMGQTKKQHKKEKKNRDECQPSMCIWSRAKIHNSYNKKKIKQPQMYVQLFNLRLNTQKFTRNTNIIELNAK